MAKKSKKNWMAKAFDPKNAGKLHDQLGVAADENIPAKKLAKAAGKPGKLGMRARLAQTGAAIARKNAKKKK